MAEADLTKPTVSEEAVAAFLKGCIGYVTDDDEYRQRVREGLAEAAPILRAGAKQVSGEETG